MSIDFFVNVFERGLLSLRETRSAEAALWRNSRGSVILPLTLVLLSCHCDHHPWFIPSSSPLRQRVLQRILLHSSAPHSSAVTWERTPRNWLLVTICTFPGGLHGFGVTSTLSFRFGSRKTPFWVFGVLFSLMVPPSLHDLSYANYFAAHSHRVLALDPTSKWCDFWAAQQPYLFPLIEQRTGFLDCRFRPLRAMVDGYLKFDFSFHSELKQQLSSISD